MYELMGEEFVLFEFEDWNWIDDGFATDEGILQLNNCILKVPIGRFKVGNFIPTIVINFTQERTFQLFNGEKTLISEHCYKCIMYDLEGKRIVSTGIMDVEKLQPMIQNKGENYAR